MEKKIISELIEDFASMIGLPLEENDIENIYVVYEEKKFASDIQSILLTELYAIQKERVESQVL